MLNVDLTLDDRVLRRITREMRPRVSAVVKNTAYAIEGRAKASMSGPKSGRLYVRAGRIHQASAPGEAPAVDTGNLANSIQTHVLAGGLTAEVTAGAEYGLYLELGTLRMAPRPFFAPATEAERAAFVAAIRRVVGP